MKWPKQWAFLCCSFPNGKGIFVSRAVSKCDNWKAYWLQHELENLEAQHLRWCWAFDNEVGHIYENPFIGRRCLQSSHGACWSVLNFTNTPKHGSWLNIAEVELSVLSRQCLNRRIGDWNTLRQEIAAWTARRNQQNSKINWRFTTEDARIKLKKLYPSFDV